MSIFERFKSWSDRVFGAWKDSPDDVKLSPTAMNFTATRWITPTIVTTGNKSDKIEETKPSK